MAKAKENPWIPSGGVLVVAVAAAVVAAVLLNVYIGMVTAPYEDTQSFLALKRDVPKGKPLEDADLTVVEIPEPLVAEGYFDKFARVTSKDLVTGTDARAQLNLPKGTLLRMLDVGETAGSAFLQGVPEGYEVMTIDIEPEPTLEPGVFVTVRGRFDMQPENRTEEIEILDVLYDVKVKAIEGSAKAIQDRRRSGGNIQIILQESNVKRLLQIKERMASDRFLVTVRKLGENVRSEPTFAPEILDLMRKEEPAPVVP